MNSELCARGWAKSRPLDSNAPGRGAADCLKPAPPRHRTISIAVGILLTFLIAGGLLTLFWSAIHGRRRICHQQEKRCRRRCRSHVIPSRPPSRLTTDVARITPATAGEIRDDRFTHRPGFPLRSIRATWPPIRNIRMALAFRAFSISVSRGGRFLATSFQLSCNLQTRWQQARRSLNFDETLGSWIDAVAFASVERDRLQP